MGETEIIAILVAIAVALLAARGYFNR